MRLPMSMRGLYPSAAWADHRRLNWSLRHDRSVFDRSCVSGRGYRRLGVEMNEGQSAGGKNPAKGVLWAAATALAYSVSAIFGKNLLGGLGPESLLFWRFGIATVVLWGVLLVWRRRGGPDPFSVPRGRSLLLGVLFGLMVYVGFRSLEHLDVSVYIVVVYLYPVFVVVGSSLLGHHRASPWTWAALVVVCVGVLLTVPELFGGVGEVSILGLVLALATAVLMAVFMIVSGRVVPAHIDGVVKAAWNVLGAALLMAVLLVGDGLTVPSGARMVTEVLLFALVSTVISNVTFFRALRHVAPGIVAMIMTAEVALAIMWSMIFLDESVEAIKLVGAGVVMAGVLMVQFVSMREGRGSHEMDETWESSPVVP